MSDLPQTAAELLEIVTGHMHAQGRKAQRVSHYRDVVGLGAQIEALPDSAPVHIRIELLNHLATAHLNLAKRDNETSGYDEVIRLSSNVLAIDENNADAHILQGRANLELGNAREALMHLEIALKQSQSADTLRFAGRALMALGRFGPARVYFRQAMDRPTDVGLIAQSYFAEGKYRETIDTYKIRLDVSPHHPEALLFTLTSAVKLNDAELARNTAWTMVNHCPKAEIKSAMRILSRYKGIELNVYGDLLVTAKRHFPELEGELNARLNTRRQLGDIPDRAAYALLDKEIEEELGYKLPAIWRDPRKKRAGTGTAWKGTTDRPDTEREGRE